MDLISVREAAHRLGVCPMTIRRYVNRGLITAVRIGPKPLLRVSALDVDLMMQPVLG